MKLNLLALLTWLSAMLITQSSVFAAVPSQNTPLAEIAYIREQGLENGISFPDLNTNPDSSIAISPDGRSLITDNTNNTSFTHFEIASNGQRILYQWIDFSDMGGQVEILDLANSGSQIATEGYQPAWRSENTTDQATNASLIAFIRNGNLWVAAPDGGGTHQLTTQGGYSEPAWSPIEDKIAYVHRFVGNNSKDAWEIGIFDLSTNQEEIIISADKTPMVLLDEYWKYSNPRWAPDGKAMYYIASDGRVVGDYFHKYDLNLQKQADNFGEFFTRGFDISLVDGRITYTGFSNAEPTGYDLHLAAADGSQHQTLIPLTNEVFIDSPRWSLDGQRIAFAGRGGAFGPNGIVIVDPDQMDPSIYPAVVDSRWSAGLSWSPNGEKIVYASEGMLRILDLSSGNSEAIIPGSDPSWKPDAASSESAISEGQTHPATPSTSTSAYILAGDIWLLDSHTGQRSQITSGTNYNYLDWAPDGAKLLAISEDQRVDLVEIPTGEIMTIGRISKGQLIKPSWSPDSKKVFFDDYTNDIFATRVVDTDGNVLLDLSDRMLCPIWEQDGNILYYFEASTTDQGFWQHDFSAQTTKRIFNYQDTHEYGLAIEACYVAANSPWFAVWNYWSEGTGQVIVLNTQGDEYIIFTPESDRIGGNPLGDWSPDGRQFVFQSGNTFWASAGPIYIYSVEDQQTTTLWSEGGLHPRWSPDGKTIAFTTWKGGLNLIDVASRQVQVLLPDAPENKLHEYVGWGGQQIGFYATEEMEPSWLPNGSQIMFTYPEGFYILEIATGDQQWIDQGLSPKWQPIPPKVEPTATPTMEPPTPTTASTETMTPVPTETQSPSQPIVLEDAETSGESQNRYFGIGVVLIIVLVVGGGIGTFVWYQQRKRQPARLKPPTPEPAPMPPAQSTAAWLIGIQGSFKGQTLSVFDGFLIGRSSESDLRLTDPRVSRLHVKFRFALNTWYLQDQGSQSGTLVNGEWIDSAKLKNGDRIRIADFEFEFRKTA